MNGSFTLPQALRARAGNAQSQAGAFARSDRAAARPSCWTYSGPISNDPVTLEFRQGIGANDALRKGAYRKTLTVSVSTATP